MVLLPDCSGVPGERRPFSPATPGAWPATSPAPDLLIVDPPRAGLDSKLIDEILRREIPRILYISCDPASLARDLARLETYEILDIAAYDLFPERDMLKP